ncbi:MAG: nuclease-related domain-containing protein, partial [Anaerolineae bacterium]|nr:nuclease-related domain-containing protein [Anaerolineae bacterium]
KQRTKFTQRGSLIGMGLLMASLFLAWRNQLLSWVLLIAGFMVAMAAVRIGNRYVRPPRRDAVLDKLLKGLDNKYELYHYLFPAEHLLLTPSGLIAIHMQEHTGRITVQGDRWRQRPAGLRLKVLLGEPGLGNPFNELRHELARTSKALAGILAENSLPLEGMVVFYSPKAQLQVENPAFPAVAAGDVKAAVRAMAEAHPPLSTRARKEIAAALRGEEPAEEG